MKDNLLTKYFHQPCFCANLLSGILVLQIFFSGFILVIMELVEWRESKWELNFFVSSANQIDFGKIRYSDCDSVLLYVVKSWCEENSKFMERRKLCNTWKHSNYLKPQSASFCSGSYVFVSRLKWWEANLRYLMVQLPRTFLEIIYYLNRPWSPTVSKIQKYHLLQALGWNVDMLKMLFD